jgi:hypothetical protein
MKALMLIKISQTSGSGLNAWFVNRGGRDTKPEEINALNAKLLYTAGQLVSGTPFTTPFFN